jgi:hypothetical protein
LDFLYLKSQRKILAHAEHTDPTADCNIAIKNLSVDACCGHHCGESNAEYNLWHPLWHSVKIWFILFSVSLILNIIIMNIGEQNL